MLSGAWVNRRGGGGNSVFCSASALELEQADFRCLLRGGYLCCVRVQTDVGVISDSCCACRHLLTSKRTHVQWDRHTSWFLEVVSLRRRAAEWCSAYSEGNLLNFFLQRDFCAHRACGYVSKTRFSRLLDL